MNAPLVLFARYVRDLLQQPEGDVVVIGRDNNERETTNQLTIAVDQLAPSEPVTVNEVYDGDAESMSYATLLRTVFTIDFYGAGAYEQVTAFMGLCRSEAGRQIAKALSIEVAVPLQYTDVRLLTGSQYSEHYQLELVGHTTNKHDTETLRVDIAQVEITTDSIAGGSAFNFEV